MLIVGAKGFAKEVLEVVYKNATSKTIALYDDVNTDIGDMLYGKFPILKNENQVKDFFNEFGYEFTIGIGSPILRKALHDKFIKLNGVFTSTISIHASIGRYDVKVGVGTNILANAVISNSAHIGKGCIIYYNTIITHDCIVGDFVELSPNAILLGRVQIGDYTTIGANATILPNVKIGNNVVVGAGAVVSKDLPDNCVAVGIPAKIIRERTPLNF